MTLCGAAVAESGGGRCFAETVGLTSSLLASSKADLSAPLPLADFLNALEKKKDLVAPSAKKVQGEVILVDFLRDPSRANVRSSFLTFSPSLSSAIRG